jgi:acyl-coenzyme A synthetase/AMP-(fatty) acid ligase
VEGELFIGGDALARGYLGRPGATAESFVPDPHSQSGTRLYRTADRARWRDEDTLEFLGRVDGQIKVRGHRVECGEVEHVLQSHPQVRDAVVVPRYRGAECDRLDARVVAEPGSDPRALTAWLEARLPHYMIPRILVVTGLTRTLNGKTERTPVKEGTRS